MLDSAKKADITYRIHHTIQALCTESGKGMDASKASLMLGGMFVETAFLFDNCEEALQASFVNLGRLLECQPVLDEMLIEALPPPSIIDFDTEMGRATAREFFEEWLDCPYEFHDILLTLTHQIFTRWESLSFEQGIRHGQSKAESFRLLIEGTYRAMAYELGAQELCDVLIEKKIGVDGWALTDCIGSLAGLSGQKLSYSHGGRNQCCWFRGADLPDLLDQTAYVMTQEAVRLGVPTGTDWRFGLPANDVPASPPSYLVNEVELVCRGFFQAIYMDDEHDQAVCAAKAAGRMLALACSGEKPELEPAIGKPLAMAAMTESYKSACVEYAAVNYSI